MTRLFVLGTCLLSLISHAFSTPVPQADPLRRPLVIWHGLGDSYASPGMLEFMQLIKDMHPGIYIHSVYLREDLEEDRRAGFVRRLLSMLSANSPDARGNSSGM